MLNRLFVLIISVTFLVGGMHAQRVTANKAFPVGEHFVLDAYFNLGLLWIKLGTADFAVSEENGNYVYTVTARNYPKWNRIYEVNTLHVASCTKDMRPLYMWCKVHENGKYSEDSYTYKCKGDHYEIRRKCKSQKYPNGLDTLLYLPLEAHDIINSIYVARNADLTVNGGKNIPFYPIFGNGIHIMYGDVIGRATIKTREGDVYKCTKNIAKVGSGTIVDNSEPVYVYVTDDDRLIPVLVEAKLSIGYIKVYLKNYEILPK